MRGPVPTEIHPACSIWFHPNRSSDPENSAVFRELHVFTESCMASKLCQGLISSDGGGACWTALAPCVGSENGQPAPNECEAGKAQW